MDFGKFSRKTSQTGEPPEFLTTTCITYVYCFSPVYRGEFFLTKAIDKTIVCNILANFSVQKLKSPTIGITLS